MGKNKSLTEEEREIHRKATSLRKLTDKQLVERLEKISNSEKLPLLLTADAGKENPPAELSEQSGAVQALPRSTVGEFLLAVEHADIAGIGKVTIKKLNDFARENNYI